MAQLKRFTSFKGIDVRRNDLQKDPNYLRDALNVYIEDNNNNDISYRKRAGLAIAETITFLDGLAEYHTREELLILSPTPVIWKNGVNQGAVTTTETDPLSGTSNQIADWSEVNGVIYIAKEDKELLKYDGNKLYRAGLPTSYSENPTRQEYGTVFGLPPFELIYETPGNWQQNSQVSEITNISVGASTARNIGNIAVNDLVQDKNGDYWRITEVNGTSYVLEFVLNLSGLNPVNSFDKASDLIRRYGRLPVANYKYSFEYEFTDAKKNTTISDASSTIHNTITDRSQISIEVYPVYQNTSEFSSVLSTTIDGFNNVYAEVVDRYPTAWGSSDNSPVITIPVLAGHTITTGDKVYLQHTVTGFTFFTFRGSAFPDDYLWECFEVTSTTATSITVNNDRLLNVYVIPRIEIGGTTYISNTLMNVYRAADTGAGFGDNFYLESLPIRMDSSTTITYVDRGLRDVGGDSLIGRENINIPPYRSKYIEFHKGLLFQGGIKDRIEKSDGTFLFEDRPLDVAFGSTDGFATLENFTLGGNVLTIGDDHDGNVTALHSHNDQLIVFKERGIHFISGNVLAGAFRVDKYHGSEIGCVSHGSVQEVGGLVFFLSERGVYGVVGGGAPRNVSEAITPLFLEANLEKSKATSTYSLPDESYYLHIPIMGGGSRMFVYNQDFDAWTVWDTPASGGLAYFENKLHMGNGTQLLIEQSTRNDDYKAPASGAIDAYILSNFENLGEPSIPKKFINVKAFALTTINSEITVQTFKDWVDNVVKTNSIISFTAAQRFDKVKVLAGDNKAHSFAVRFSNNNENEDFSLTGWEIEYETSYKKMKE